MIRRSSYIQFLLLILLLLFEGITIPKLQNDASYFSLDDYTIYSSFFRRHELSEDMITYMKNSKEPGRAAGLYLLETHFHSFISSSALTEQTFQKLERAWQICPSFSSYISACEKIWTDIRYFPIMYWKDNPDLTVNYVDSWMNERTYGGTRGHEGTDLMSSVNERGLFPVVSMTDGMVTNKGWLPQGGWRIGVTAPHGGYFYYAHLDSYSDLEIGDEVQAGDLLGYMGDSGYGQEGTTGKFPVHLHLGIYLEETGKEISINPYWILKYTENSKLFCRKSARSMENLQHV